MCLFSNLKWLFILSGMREHLPFLQTEGREQRTFLGLKAGFLLQEGGTFSTRLPELQEVTAKAPCVSLLQEGSDARGPANQAHATRASRGAASGGRAALLPTGPCALRCAGRAPAGGWGEAAGAALGAGCPPASLGASPPRCARFHTSPL